MCSAYHIGHASLDNFLSFKNRNKYVLELGIRNIDNDEFYLFQVKSI